MKKEMQNSAGIPHYAVWNKHTVYVTAAINILLYIHEVVQMYMQEYDVQAEYIICVYTRVEKRNAVQQPAGERNNYMHIRTGHGNVRTGHGNQR